MIRNSQSLKIIESLFKDLSFEISLALIPIGVLVFFWQFNLWFIYCKAALDVTHFETELILLLSENSQTQRQHQSVNKYTVLYKTLSLE